jgi:diguanylate cyclase (GGDEF)-like protein
VIVEGARLTPEAVELCRMYGQQVGQAMENLALWERATTDGLTRLYNRTFGAQRLEEIRSLDLRQGRATSVLLIDVDRFKAVNDTYGHAGGDLVLRAVASTVQSASRRSDVVARWGGEEILMVLPDTGDEAVLVVAERVRSAIQDRSVAFEGREVRVTASIGAATAGVGDRCSMDALVAMADQGLYAAKNGGRNRVCVKRRAGTQGPT